MDKFSKQLCTQDACIRESLARVNIVENHLEKFVLDERGQPRLILVAAALQQNLPEIIPPSPLCGLEPKLECSQDLQIIGCAT